MSVIFNSEGAELRFTLCVLCATNSSTGENMNALPNATPPNADFFKKERREFSVPSTLFSAFESTAGSFKPSLFNNFCAGVIFRLFIVARE
jgi:hypothetical protein